jgi:(1->4)-alpha-D-glucan 1-alpha-D-glucosylmutase
MKPRATYRLQCHKEFGFQSVEEIAGYLSRLGVSHVYASPWLKARTGSSSGYDIVDHQSLNPELGDEEAFESMIATLDEKGLGRILDIVPNNMSVSGSDNPLWLDVLEWGPASSYAGWFDIDWQPDRFSLRDKLLVPLLGKQYGIELHAGKLMLKFDAEEGSFAVWAYDTHKLPICPLHYQRIVGDTNLQLERLGDCFATIAEWGPQITLRSQGLKEQLAAFVREHSSIRLAIEEALVRFNGRPGVEESWNELHVLIQDQHWRAAHFRVAGDDINYRRFFDINELAALRMELPTVFEHAHALVFRLIKEGKLDGLRIDHVDGLLNPEQYLKRLRSNAGDSVYLIVEKILAHHESLRSSWPVEGTTGYEFANLALGVLIDPEGEKPFTECYTEFTGERRNFAEIAIECKLRIMGNEMVSELNVLAREAARIAYQTPETADFTQNVLRRGIRAIAACFPVYRTYVDGEDNGEEDRRDLNWAMKLARCNEIDIDPSVFDFLEALISGDLVTKGRSGFSRYWVLRCAMKFQQYTGPVMAKGVEDTAFYRYNRFLALNEVGGRPDIFGLSVASFHKTTAQRARRWPQSMLTTSTHDTKLGEDARARLAVLSEMPEQWAKQVRLWSHALRARRGDITAEAPPSRNDEYRLYQLLVATWPENITSIEECETVGLGSYTERIKQAMYKSIREAKVLSTWAAPNNTYEEAVMAFIDGALDIQTSKSFLSTFLPFQQQVASFGMENSLIMTVLKLTCPGVPDVYQGSELWDLSLVDPDNRRPVDYGRRIQMLEDLETQRPSVHDLLSHWPTGALKLFITTRILNFRSAHTGPFSEGRYEPLLTAGPKADYICGFARIHEESSVLVIAARFPAHRQQSPSWNGTTIATPPEVSGKTLTNVLTGRKFSSAELEVVLDLVLDGLPVAVLTTDSV